MAFTLPIHTLTCTVLYIVVWTKSSLTFLHPTLYIISIYLYVNIDYMVVVENNIILCKKKKKLFFHSKLAKELNLTYCYIVTPFTHIWLNCASDLCILFFKTWSDCTATSDVLLSFLVPDM